MYMNTLLHYHFCLQIITDRFLLIKVSHPIHTIPEINAHLLYPYAPGSILSDTNYYIALHVFLVVSMATNIVQHLAIISILRGGGSSTGSGYHQYGETICGVIGPKIFPTSSVKQKVCTLCTDIIHTHTHTHTHTVQTFISVHGSYHCSQYACAWFTLDKWYECTCKLSMYS